MIIISVASNVCIGMIAIGYKSGVTVHRSANPRRLRDGIDFFALSSFKKSEEGCTIRENREGSYTGGNDCA